MYPLMRHSLWDASLAERSANKGGLIRRHVVLFTFDDLGARYNNLPSVENYLSRPRPFSLRASDTSFATIFG
jgi:hypothetical protein